MNYRIECTSHLTCISHRLLNVRVFLFKWRYNIILATIVIMGLITSLGIFYREEQIEESNVFSDETKQQIHNLALQQFIAHSVIVIINLLIWYNIKYSFWTEYEQTFTGIAYLYFITSTATQIWICFEVVKQLSMIHNITILSSAN